MSHETRESLGLWSGIGLIAANMIGAGVFLSAGFMAQDLDAATILIAWVVGSVQALSGALAYGAVARAIPRSGGEYRYISELWHPAGGFVGGWASLLVGFSAPIAVNALAAGAYAATLAPVLDPVTTSVALVVGLTAAHAAGMRLSRRVQNGLVAFKAALLAVFVALGLSLGRWEWPRWQPPSADGDFPLAAFATGLFFIAFAFSGWNATAYAASEFREPRRTVPRAMLVGCSLVALLYLAVNWILVANLTPARAMEALGDATRQTTLGHVVLTDILGASGGSAMSAIILVAFVSSMSAMMFVGPRVYAAMAEDGYLPSALAADAGKPPRGSVVLQGALAILLVTTHELREALEALGGILTLFATLVALGVFRLRGDVSRLERVAAGVFATASIWMLYFGFRSGGRLLLWAGVILVSGLAAYAASRVWGAAGRASRE